MCHLATASGEDDRVSTKVLLFVNFAVGSAPGVAVTPVVFGDGKGCRIRATWQQLRLCQGYPAPLSRALRHQQSTRDKMIRVAEMHMNWAVMTLQLQIS